MTGTASAPCVVGGATGTAPAPGVEGIRVSGVPTEAVRDACNPGDWGVSVEFPPTLPPRFTTKVTGTSKWGAMFKVILTAISDKNRIELSANWPGSQAEKRLQLHPRLFMPCVLSFALPLF